MPKPAWENLDAFLNIREFATTVLITPQTGEPFSVPGIFDDAYLNSELGEYDMDLIQPRVLCKEEDVVSVLRGDSVTIEDRIFDVLNGSEGDGTGMAVLHLSEKPPEEPEEEESP
jgi:hypothetical protein